MSHSIFDLSGKTAVVIGGTSGIGRTLALGLAEAGADVVATGRREEHVRSVAAEIENLGRKTLVRMTDVTNRESLERLTVRSLRCVWQRRCIGELCWQNEAQSHPAGW